jgi:hypothetical protein
MEKKHEITPMQELQESLAAVKKVNLRFKVTIKKDASKPNRKISISSSGRKT